MDSSSQQWAQHQQGWPTAAAAPQGYHQPTSLEEVRTLWIGNLQYWVDENYLNTCFAHTGEVVSIKIIRNKLTGQPEGYGFVEFVSHSAAERILQTYNGTQMPGTEQMFRLNWASFGMEKRPDAGPDHSIFVGDLAPDVTDYLLQETFRTQYPSVRGAKVVTDPSTGRSKGYGFVKFADEAERNRAMAEMNGIYCSTRPMRISAATPKKPTAFQPQTPAVKTPYSLTYATPPAQPAVTDGDTTNTTIYVGSLDLNVTEDELRQYFAPYGDLVSVKVPQGKGCGFVQFGLRASAEEAIQRMNGTVIGQQAVRLSWCRSPETKQDSSAMWTQQADPNQWAGYYGYGQGYDAYAYGASHDPSLYAYGAYAGYGAYPHQGDGISDMSAMGGAIPTPEHREEPFDTLALPDVDKLNGAYIAVHGNSMVGRPLWLRHLAA
ncbi:RNA-binding (RRM/RBD/RNP motifs) family protein [Wolffia australiana]